MAREEAISFHRISGIAVATLGGSEITPDVGDRLHLSLLEAGNHRQGHDLILNLSGLTFLGSVGVRVLVVFYTRIRERGGRLALVGLNADCMKVLRVVGLAKVFDLFPDVDAAVEAFRRKTVVRTGCDPAPERRQRSDRRAGAERRTSRSVYSGTERRTGKDRRRGKDRRLFAC